jgi:hypothetical protein
VEASQAVYFGFHNFDERVVNLLLIFHFRTLAENNVSHANIFLFQIRASYDYFEDIIYKFRNEQLTVCRSLSPYFEFPWDHILLLAQSKAT